MKTFGRAVIAGFFLLLMLIPAFVFSVGIRPARLTYPFEEGKEFFLDYTVINRVAIPARFAIYVCGALWDKVNFTGVSSSVYRSEDCTAAQREVLTKLNNGDITIDQAGIFLNPGQEKQIQARLTLPSTAGYAPGIVDTRIGVLDLPLVAKPGQTVVGGLAAVESQLWFRVPYPGTRLVLTVQADDAPLGQKARLGASVVSEGTENVENAALTIDILDPNGVRVERIDAGSQSVQSGHSISYGPVLWDTKGHDVGTYTALFRLSFASQTITQETTFRIGGLEAVIKSVGAPPVLQGGIGKISIEVESKWGDVIPGVYADVAVLNKLGKQVGSAKTQSIDLKPFETTTLQAFWETGNAELGAYDLNATLHYVGNESFGKGAIEVVKELPQSSLPWGDIALVLAIILFIAAAWFMRNRIRIKIS